MTQFSTKKVLHAKLSHIVIPLRGRSVWSKLQAYARPPKNKKPTAIILNRIAVEPGIHSSLTTPHTVAMCIAVCGSVQCVWNFMENHLASNGCNDLEKKLDMGEFKV